MTDSMQATQNTEDPSTGHQKEKSKWRWLTRSLGLFALLFLFFMIFLSTGKGQRTTIQLVDRWLESIDINQVEGSLQDGLVLNQITFTQKGVEATLGQAKFQINFRCFLQREICIQEVALRDAKVQVQTALLPPAKSSQSSSARFDLPIGVNLERFSLDNIQLNLDETELSLAHFHTALKGKGKRLSILPTALHGVNISLSQVVSKSAKTTTDEPKTIDWEALKAKLSQPLLDKSSDFLAQIALSVEDFRAENLQLKQQKADTAPQEIVFVELLGFQLLSSQTPNGKALLQLPQLILKSNRGSLNGSGQISAEQGYPLDFQLQADLQEWKEIALPPSKLNLTLQGLLLGETALEFKTQGAFESRLSAQVQLAEPRLPWHLKLHSPLFSYPFSSSAKPATKVKNLDLSLTGDVLNYQLQGGLELSGIGITTGLIQISGQGGLTGFTLDKLSMEILKGVSVMSGTFDWQKGLSWDTNIDLKKLYTQDLFPEWRVFISGQINTKGQVGQGTSGQDWAISFNQTKLAGVLGGKPLVLSGELHASSKGGIFVPALNIHHGTSRIESKGQLNANTDFHAKIDAPSLKGFLPKLNGSLKGDIHLSGDIQQPQLKLDLVAEQFIYDQLQLQGVRAKGDIQTEQQVTGQIDLALRQLTTENGELRNVALELNGTEKAHQLKFISSGEPFALNFTAEGAFDRSTQVWQGKIPDMTLASPIGQWKSDKLIQLGYEHGKAESSISAHCWLHAQAQLCFPRTFQLGKTGVVPLELKQFDLAIFEPFIKELGQIAGNLKAEGEVQWAHNQPPKAKIDLSANQIKFEPIIDHRRFPLLFTPVKVGIELAENTLTLNSDIALENNGRLKGKLQLKDLAKQRQLSGDIQLNDLNLSLIAPLLARDEQIHGVLNADLTLGGHLQLPQLHGEVKLSKLATRLPTMPFDITQGELNMALHGTKSTLQGQIHTKDSQLNLEGDATWSQSNGWHTRVKAKAERFKLALPGIAKLEISPDIEAKAEPNRLSITGKVEIPWARILIEGLPESAIKVSNDEVIMEASARKRRQALPTQLSKSPSGMAIASDVAIQLGEDVKLDAYGLKTHLHGTVKVNQGKKGLGLYGQVNLRKGTFTSFGQDLVIRKGVIAFTGLPSQPTLDVEAIRNPEAMENSAITAGVRVTGMADSPEVKIFSTPNLPQDQALSYVLTGRALDNTGDASSGNSVAAALIGMSLSKSSKLVGQVGGAFGIQDLNVTTAGIGDNTKVVVSGSLSPRFSLKYGVGLFAPLTELTLRYRLAPNLYLQGVSSIDQAVDLLYHFEF